MKPKFEIGDRIRHKDSGYIGTVVEIDTNGADGYYVVYAYDETDSYYVHESDIEFENPKLTFLTRLQELLASFDAKICSWAEGCDTSGIDVYFGEQCVIAFPINRTTECTTITAENVFDYDKD